MSNVYALSSFPLSRALGFDTFLALGTRFRYCGSAVRTAPVDVSSSRSSVPHLVSSRLTINSEQNATPAMHRDAITGNESVESFAMLDNAMYVIKIMEHVADNDSRHGSKPSTPVRESLSPSVTLTTGTGRVRLAAKVY